jgi:hypothetical protein
MSFGGPVASGPPSIQDAGFSIGAGLIGLAWLLFSVHRKKVTKRDWLKVLLFSAVILLFIVGGIVELSEVR